MADVLLSPAARTSGKSPDICFGRLSKRLQLSNDLTWAAEETATIEKIKKRPDIFLRQHDSPAVVVENKVSAGFTDGQLEYYGKWLANQNPARNPGAALVLLTHATSPPEDFLDPVAKSPYKIPLRSVCTWMEVYEWLGRQSPTDPVTRHLMQEFCIFLEERNLNGITKGDTAVLATILSHGVVPKIEPLFDMVRNKVQPRLQRLGYRFEPKIDVWDSTGGYAIWDWCYFRPKNPDWYIGWGLTVGGDFFGATLEKSLMAFVHVGPGAEGAPKLPVDVLPLSFKASLRKSGWKFLEDGSCLKVEMASKLASAPSGLTQTFMHWLDQPLDEADELLQRSYALLRSRGTGRSSKPMGKRLRITPAPRGSGRKDINDRHDRHLAERSS